MALADMLRDKATIEEPKRTSTGKGGQTQTWRTVKTGEPFAFRPIRPNERTQGDQQSAQVDHVAYCNATAPVKRDQRLTSANTGRQFLIVAVRNPGGLDVHYEIDCYEIQRGG